MGRWRIGAALLVAVTCFTSHAIGDGPPVPQEAAGTWSSASGSVDAATGAAVASYAFDLPPARGDVQPSLGLAYSQTASVGAAGEGWSLALPEVVRRGLGGAPPRYDGGDHFELSGQPLVEDCYTTCDPATLPSWASGWRRYRGRAERAPVRIYVTADEATWRLALPQGGFAEFGIAVVAADGDGGGVDWGRNAPGTHKIYRWKLVRLFDAGNALNNAVTNVAAFKWKHMDGLPTPHDVSVLTDIFYTQRPSYSLTSFSSYAHHVRLEYDPWRPNTYLATPPIWNRVPEWRLRTVSIASRGIDPLAPRERVRVYRLRYRAETIRRHPFLESIAMEGRCSSPVVEAYDGRDFALPDEVCPGPLPPTTFEYTPELGRINPVTGIYEGIVQTSIRFVDENDQAIPFPIFEWEAINNGKLALVDVNKDGVPDLFAFRGGSPLPDGGLPDGYVFINPGDASTATVTTFKRAPVTGSSGSLGNDRLAVFGAWDDSTPTWQSPLRAAPVTFLFRPAGVDPAAFPVQARRIERDSAPSSGWHIYETPLAAGVPRYPHVFGDFDGDGTIDALYIDPGADANSNSDDVVRLALSKRSQARFAQGEATGLFLLKDARGPTYWTLADMNGDSLPDYVTARDPLHGDNRLVYIPRNASFESTSSAGTSTLFGCDATATECLAAVGSPGFNPYANNNAGAALKEFVLDSVPPYVPGQADKLLVHDVTGDGLADVILLRDMADRVDVSLFVNTDGKSFTLPYTHPVYKDPNYPISANGALLADMNANGVDDLVLFANSGAEVIDFQGNERPGLLVKINHASGATTTFTYERLIDHEKRSLDRWNSELGPWTSHAPIPMYVVTNVSTASGAPSPYNFSRNVVHTYRDPIFDRWRGRLVGFRRTRVTSGPLETETQYLFDDCFPNDQTDVDPAHCPSQEYDEGLVLAGLPAIVEQRSRASGAYASTTVYSYIVKVGGGSANVNMVHAGEVNTFVYDLANYSPQSQVVQLVASMRGQESPVMQDVPVRATGVRLRSRQYIDEDWRQLAAWDDGQVNVQDGSAIDRPIKTTTTWHPQGQFWERVHRPASVTIGYDGLGLQTPLIADDGLIRRMSYQYDAAGRLTRGTTDISGSLPLQRFHESGLQIAQEPPSSNAINATLFTIQYDAYGNPTTTKGAVSECTVREYAPTYLDSLQAVYESKDGSCSTSASRLKTGFTFDRGLAAMTSTSSPAGSETKYEYDHVGRLLRVLETPGTGGTPIVKVQLTHFDIASYTDAFSRVHKTKIARLDGGGAEISAAWYHATSLGAPIITFTQADPSAGDITSWIAQPGPLLLDDVGVPMTNFRPTFHTGSPTDVYASEPVVDRVFAYDLLARPALVRRASDWNVVDQRVYRPLSLDVWDAETTPENGGGAHVGEYLTVFLDGHGRTVRTSKRSNTTTAVETRFTHLPTGQVSATQRDFTDGTGTPRSVLRWFRFDSLGRMVENAEPNTTKGFTADPANAGGMKAWRYAYDRSGRLVGTRDARGCGKNLQYDPAGRLLAEDYSPCLDSHIGYLAPNFTTGVGTEVIYRYDDPEVGQTTDCSPSALCMQGKVVSVRDRGAHTRFAYDARGRRTAIERRIAKPGVPSNDPATRYAEHWFRTSTSYDDLDRATAMTTGAESPQLLNPASVLSIGYSTRDLPKVIEGSYGTLASEFVFDADGFQREVVYGNAAATERRTPDANRRLQHHELFRSAPPVWGDPAYSPPTDPNELMMAHQLVLADTTFTPDRVGNLKVMSDARNAQLWPDGYKPRTTQLSYDSMYRLISADYGGIDPQTSPFAPEEASGDARPLPRVQTPLRARSQSFTYDGLGNITQSQDDGAFVFDRSLGSVTHGFASNKPAQLFMTSGAGGMGVDAYYDDAGNLSGLDLDRPSSSCSLPTGKCSQRFLYNWDEVGQLVRARRWDFGTLVGNPVYPAVPAGTPAAEIDYQYSQGQRVVRHAHDPSPTLLYTVDVFGSLRLTNARYDAASGYEQDRHTETLFLGGVARVFYEPGLPNVGSDRHVFLTIGDRLGSASAIIDRDTSELVEHITYQAYGAVDSDYRTARWGSFREDLRFTGKEEDIELGLQYFGARYYSPNLGRFISPDPLTIHAAAGDVNPYAYVRGRVYNMVDPLGLDGSCIGQECTGSSGGGGEPPMPGIVDALRCLFGGCNGGSGGGGGNGKPSGPQTGPRGFNPYPQMPFVPPPQYALPSNIAIGAFNTTYPGIVISAATNPIDDRSEYMFGIGKGAILGACFWCVMGGSAAGALPDQFYLVGASDDGQRGIGDGFGLLGAAIGFGELASISGLGGMGGGGGSRIALSLGDSLPGFEARTGARGWLWWDGAGSFESNFGRAARRADSIHFNLDGGFDMKQAAEAADWSRQSGKVTNAEFREVITNPRLRNKTIFYLNRTPIETEKVMQMYWDVLRLGK